MSVMYPTAMHVDLGDVVRRGTFGDLRIGADEAWVIARLGEPEARSRKGRPPEILRYGMVQLLFDAGRLIVMSVHFDRVRSCSMVEFVGWFPPVGTTREQFVDMLQVRGVAYAPLADSEESMLRTEGNAVVSFVQNELESISIESSDLRHSSHGGRRAD